MVKKQTRSFRSSDGKTDIHVLLWIPEGTPRAVMQIAHGMVEYVDRYDRFARFLAGQGFVVCGNDHLGHGQSVTSDEELGFFRAKDGNGAVISDMRRLMVIMNKRYPDIPYFLLGHSMGSFFAREYMEMYGEELDGVILSGTGSTPPPVLRFGKNMCRSFAVRKGWHHRSRTLNNMALGSYNRSFEPARTPYDWLTHDEEMVDRYAENPLTTFCFTVNGYYTLFTAVQKAQSRRLIAQIPKDLPVLFVSGDCDPVGNFKKGVITACNALIKAGLTDVQLHFFEGDRHEILNELDYEDVHAYLMEWLKERMLRAK